MRLRRLELVVIGITLAFACFIGGYFTGRSTSAVSVAPVISQHHDEIQASEKDKPVPAAAPVLPEKEVAAPPAAAPQADSAVQAPEPSGMPRDSDGRININSASKSELMDLPGIGSVLSERIVDYRKSNGPFSKIEDLRKVSGIGSKRYEAIKDKITV